MPITQKRRRTQRKKRQYGGGIFHKQKDIVEYNTVVAMLNSLKDQSGRTITYFDPNKQNEDTSTISAMLTTLLSSYKCGMRRRCLRKHFYPHVLEIHYFEGDMNRVLTLMNEMYGSTSQESKLSESNTLTFRKEIEKHINEFAERATLLYCCTHLFIDTIIFNKRTVVIKPFQT